MAPHPNGPSETARRNAERVTARGAGPCNLAASKCFPRLDFGLLSQRPVQVRRNRRKNSPSSTLGNLVAEASLPGATRKAVLFGTRTTTFDAGPCQPSKASVGWQSPVLLGTIRRHSIQAVDRVMLIVSDATGREFRFRKKSRRTARNVNKNERLACRLSEGRQSSVPLGAGCQSRDADCAGYIGDSESDCNVKPSQREKI